MAVGKNNILLKFRSKEKAERLAEMGFTYMIDNSGDKPEYAFALTNDIANKLVGNFDNKDYYFTNRLCFCATSAQNKTPISVTNAKQKGGGGDEQ